MKTSEQKYEEYLNNFWKKKDASLTAETTCLYFYLLHILYLNNWDACAASDYELSKILSIPLNEISISRIKLFNLGLINISIYPDKICEYIIVEID